MKRILVDTFLSTFFFVILWLIFHKSFSQDAVVATVCFAVTLLVLRLLMNRTRKPESNPDERKREELYDPNSTESE